jgi:GT2 family glycosyltransferase
MQSLKLEKVILVDDASPLNYEPKSRNVDVIKMPINSGPAKARNLGIDMALKNRIEHLLFTDHDCILDKDWNLNMTNFLKNSEYAAVGGMTYSWGNTIYDYYHDNNGTLTGKWLLPERKEYGICLLLTFE